jgi:hypothetical protein
MKPRWLTRKQTIVIYQLQIHYLELNQILGFTTISIACVLSRLPNLLACHGNLYLKVQY